MAATLLAAGAEGKRGALPNSRILLHQPHIQQGLSGQVSGVKIYAIGYIINKRTDKPR
jgi:ATP-dependent Clp protease, protease subunit